MGEAGEKTARGGAYSEAVLFLGKESSDGNFVVPGFISYFSMFHAENGWYARIFQSRRTENR